MADETALAEPTEPSPSRAAHRRPWLRRAARAAYLIVCNSLLCLLALECGMRIFASARPAPAAGSELDPAGPGITLHPYFQTAVPPVPGTSAGPFLAGWSIHPPEFAESAGRKRILFLGGSTTASDYPAEVQRRLDVSTPVTAYVIAWDFHCSLHSLHKFWTYVDEVRPDLVVVLDAINDLYRGFTSPAVSLPQYRADYSHYAGGLYPFWVPGSARSDGRPLFHAKPFGRSMVDDGHDGTLGGLARAVASESVLMRALRRTVSKPAPLQHDRPVDPAVDPLRALPAFRRNLENLALSAEAKGVPVLFLTMPNTARSAHNFLPPAGFFTNDGVHHLRSPEFVEAMKAFNDVVRCLDDPPHARVLDLAASLTDPVLFRDEVHLQREGLSLEAELVAQFIREHYSL